MGAHDPFEARQLRALCAMALLSPGLRLIPGQAAAAAGALAWLGPLLALPPLLGLFFLLDRLRRAYREGEALPELMLRVLGRRAGAMLLLALGLWLLLGAGLALRADSERLLVTIYPRAARGFFVWTLGIAGALAAMGPRKSLLRLGRMAEPFLLLTLLGVALAALKSVDLWELLPQELPDGPALLGAQLPALDILGFGLLALCLIPAATEEGSEGRRGGLRWLLGMVLLLTALGALIQGHFGAALSARLSAPFFALLRDLVFFRSLERLEALAVALWIFPDLLLVGLALQAAQRCLRLALGWQPEADEHRGDLSRGRWLGWLCCTLAAALGLLLAPEVETLSLWSGKLLPLGTLAVCYLLLPLGYLFGKIRKKL